MNIAFYGRRRSMWTSLHLYLDCELCGRPGGIVGKSPILHFHHRDPDTKLGNLSEMFMARSWPAAVAEMEKCDVLCRKCHRAQHPRTWRPTGEPQ